MNKLLVVGGITASGKTNLACKISHTIESESINADSRQIYKHLDIGTNKGNLTKNLDTISEYEIDGMPIHLINFLNPDQRFSVYDYKKLAEEKISEIHKRGKLPILVGGTGLYIDSIIKNYNLQSQEQNNSEYRTHLETLSLEDLQATLREIDNEIFRNLNESDQQNPRRLIRALEKLNHSSLEDTKPDQPKYDILFLYPKYDWEELKKKIENRVEDMFKEGLVNETKKVLELGFPKDSVALQGIGYKEVIEYLDGKYDLAKCIELVKIAHKQYARRQRTWFEGKGRNYNLTVIDFNKVPTDIINKFLST